jgi:hypothetical protein
MSLDRVRLILICGLTAVCAPALAQNPPAKLTPAPARPAPAPVVARPAPAPAVARPALAPVVAKPVTTPVVAKPATAAVGAKPATAAVVAKPATASVASKPPTAAQQLQYANQGAAQRNHTFDGTKAPAGPVTANTAPKWWVRRSTRLPAIRASNRLSRRFIPIRHRRRKPTDTVEQRIAAVASRRGHCAWPTGLIATARAVRLQVPAPLTSLFRSRVLPAFTSSFSSRLGGLT